MIIKCTSNGLEVYFRIAFKTGNPKEILGTNTPSIISTCMESAALLSNISTSALRLAKSPERIDGAIRCGIYVVNVFYVRTPMDNLGKKSQNSIRAQLQFPEYFQNARNIPDITAKWT